jgi:outer membrane immunogenic protein
MIALRGAPVKHSTIAFAIAAAAGLIGSSALAADVAVKAPPPAPAPVYNWTGWYAGVNAGASMGNAKTDFNVSRVTCVPSCGLWANGHGFSDRSYPDGFIGGGQIGYNWQYSPLIVVGLEADIQGALERNTNNLTNAFTDFGGTITSTNVTSYTTQIDWFGTVRGRIGYVWGNGEVLTYITGGLAYGEVKINGSNALTILCPSACSSGPPLTFTGTLNQPFSGSHVNTGWVLGYGTEGRLATPGWTWRVESYYMDLGHLNASGTFGPACVGNLCAQGGSPVTGNIATNTHFTDWILRGGLNYQFH